MLQIKYVSFLKKKIRSPWNILKFPKASEGMGIKDEYISPGYKLQESSYKKPRQHKNYYMCKRGVELRGSAP